jgi:hypothetical protein
MTAYYYLDGKNQRQGPVDDSRLRQMVRDGGLSRGVLVWAEGFANWVPANQVPGLLPTAPPPLPLDEPEVVDEPRGRKPTQGFPIPRSLPVLIGAGVAAFVLLGLFVFCGVRLMMDGGGGVFGGNVKPTGLVGRWSGHVAPTIRPDMQLPFDVECTEDGKVRFGSGGMMLPFYIDGSMKGQLVEGQTAAHGTTLTAYESATDSVTFTFHKKRQRDVTPGGPGWDMKVDPPEDTITTITLRRRGDVVELTMVTTDRMRDNIPVEMKGELRRK